MMGLQAKTEGQSNEISKLKEMGSVKNEQIARLESENSELRHMLLDIKQGIKSQRFNS